MAEHRDVLSRPAPAPDLTVRYGSGPDHLADVWLPPAGPARPLLLFLHGGYWRQTQDRGYAAPLAADLAARGYPVAAVEYRRTGRDAAGGWPTTFLDVAAAVDTVPDRLAATVGDQAGIGPPLYVGHSAGGHLALWAAVRHRLPPGAPGRRDTAPPVRGVLALAPVCEVAEAYRRDLDIGAARALLDGGPAEVPDRYAAVDPAALPAPDVPTVLLHGPGDGRVPVVLSREYAAGHDVRLVEVEGADHFALVDPRSPAWPTVLSTLAELTG